ncbi:MAG TPA: O-antigen ligase family protein [bacterium]|nr:O-antigen ligase family protein [bacterium]
MTTTKKNDNFDKKKIIDLSYSLSIYFLLGLALFFNFEEAAYNPTRFVILKYFFYLQIVLFVIFILLSEKYKKIKLEKNVIILLILIFANVSYLLINIFINTCNYFEIYKLLSALIFFVYCCCLPFELKYIMRVIIIFTIIILCWGFYQKFYGFDFILANYSDILKPEAIARLKSGRIYSVFVLPNTLASYLVITILIILAVMPEELKKMQFDNFKKNLLFFFTAVCILGIYYTKTVSVIVSMIGAILICAAFHFFTSKNRNFKILLFSLLLLFFILIVMIYLRGLEYFYHSSIKYHIANYISALNIWKSNNLLIGIGYGNFGKYYPDYILKFGNAVRYTHNYYLQILCELGIIGILLFLATLIVFLKNFIFRNNQNLFLKLLVLYFLINLVFSIDFNVLATMIYFAFSCALCLRGNEKK